MMATEPHGKEGQMHFRTVNISLSQLEQIMAHLK